MPAKLRRGHRKEHALRRTRPHVALGAGPIRHQRLAPTRSPRRKSPMANDNRDRVNIRPDDTSGTLVHTKDLDDFKLPKDEPDPRGWDVRSTDGAKVGKVEDLLFDTRERRVRYIEVALDKDLAK